LHIASFRGYAAFSSLSEKTGHCTKRSKFLDSFEFALPSTAPNQATEQKTPQDQG